MFHLFLQTNNEFFSPREKDNWKSTRNIVKQKSGNFVSVFTEYNYEIHRHKVESYGLRNKTCITYRKAFCWKRFFLIWGHKNQTHNSTVFESSSVPTALIRTLGVFPDRFPFQEPPGFQHGEKQLIDEADRAERMAGLSDLFVTLAVTFSNVYLFQHNPGFNSGGY